jgi:hypothetical protein
LPGIEGKNKGEVDKKSQETMRKYGIWSLSKNLICLSVIPAVLKPESILFNAFWMPDYRLRA